ncbi:MAG: S8 family serine peptidase [Promethearchaeota archaeon]
MKNNHDKSHFLKYKWKIFTIIGVILFQISYIMYLSSNSRNFELQLEDLDLIKKDPIDYSQNLTPQMNNFSSQMRLNPYIWESLNLTGNTNASVTILGTGIDESHIKFGTNSYDDKNFSGKIIGWNDFINDGNADPTDLNGQGTFIAAAAFGKNDTNAEIPTDEQNRICATLGGNYYHPDLFDNWSQPGFFSIKLGSINIDTENVNITVNGTYLENNVSYIQEANISLVKNGERVQNTSEQINQTYSSFDYDVGTDTGMYDIIFRYRVEFMNPVNFSVHSTVNFTLEEPSGNTVNLPGIAPDTKIVAGRVLDQNRKGRISDLISALEWVNTSADDYHIIAVTISFGNFEQDISLDLLNNAINRLIENGIMVIIAAGDYGVGTNSLNTIALNSKAIVVGSVNEKNQLTYYSSEGMNTTEGVLKPDILAPGGSRLNGFRGIISADTNDNDVNGILNDQIKNDTTIMTGTSISACFTSAAFNLLIEAMGGYIEYKTALNSIGAEKMVLTLKSYLLMTATETNMDREDNPNTLLIDESSTQNSPKLNIGEKDKHEGYGVLNIDAAVEAINKSITVGNMVEGSLISSSVNASGKHAFARQIPLEKDETYRFDLTYNRFDGDLDMYLYHNISDSNGDPILLRTPEDGYSERNGFSTQVESFFFGTINDTRNYVIVVKSINGEEVDFELNVSKQTNDWKPELSDGIVRGINGYNDTLDTFYFSVNYTDDDDIPPILIYVNISGLIENITLVKQIQSDFNFSDSCNYSAEYKFYKPGTYEYHFGVYDGGNFTRIPETGNYIFTVKPTVNAVYNDYLTNFSDISHWELEEGWNNLTQNSSIDNRGPEFDINWSMLYFGDNNTISSGMYDYSSLTASGEFLAYSPQIWINSTSKPVLDLGYRVSINAGDTFKISIRANRTGLWHTIDSFTDVQADWEYYRYNLSDFDETFIDNYIQIRFQTVIDMLDDVQKNKGIMITKFHLIQNYDSGSSGTEMKLFNISVKPQTGHKYMTYRYSVYFGAQDIFPPKKIYIEIDNKNRSMFNIFGDWNASYSKNNDEFQKGGIFFAYDICPASISNMAFKIHVFNGYSWYSTNLTDGPLLSSEEYGNIIYDNYPFNDDFSKMKVYGTPEPEAETFWYRQGTSFHYIQTDQVWYAGEYDYLGYDTEWDINLLTPLIQIPTSNEELHTIYLNFEHKLILDNGSSNDEYDYGAVYISRNLSRTWTLLQEFSEPIDHFTTENFNLNNYRGDNIMIRFFFHSDGEFIDLKESGWYIKNITLGINDLEDINPPVIKFREILPGMVISGNFILNLSITDDSGINDNSVSVYLGISELEGIISQNGNISYELKSGEYNNGKFILTVIADDTHGNRIVETIEITIYNYKFPWAAFWISLIIIGVVILSLFVYYKKYLYSATKEAIMKLLRDEKILVEEEMNTLQRKAYNIAQHRLFVRQIREETEMTTLKSEAAKPFVLYCKNKKCGKWWKNESFEWICPACGQDSLYIAVKCQVCNKWYFYDEPSEYYCKKCKIKLLK